MRIPVYCFVFECNNKCCIGDTRKANKDDAVPKTTKHSFHCYTPQAYENYPTGLKEKYSNIMVTDAEDGEGVAVMFTKPLANEVTKE
jgi:hypothetical protein